MPKLVSFTASLMLLGLLSTVSLAADQPSAPPPQGAPADGAAPPAANTPAPGSPEEVICKRRAEPATGTRISKRTNICRTRREWDEEQRIGQDTLSKIQKSGGGQSGLLQMGPAGKGQPKGAQ